jgi:hypothetical protein
VTPESGQVFTSNRMRVLPLIPLLLQLSLSAMPPRPPAIEEPQPLLKEEALVVARLVSGDAPKLDSPSNVVEMDVVSKFKGNVNGRIKVRWINARRYYGGGIEFKIGADYFFALRKNKENDYYSISDFGIDWLAEGIIKKGWLKKNGATYQPAGKFAEVLAKLPP